MKDQLTEMLETAGVSQPVAAELLGVSDRTIRRWATGETQIPEGTVEKLRLALLAPIEEEPDVFARMSDAIIPHEAKYRVDAEALAALRNWDTSLHSRRAMPGRCGRCRQRCSKNEGDRHASNVSAKVAKRAELQEWKELRGEYKRDALPRKSNPLGALLKARNAALREGRRPPQAYIHWLQAEAKWLKSFKEPDLNDLYRYTGLR